MADVIVEPRHRHNGSISSALDSGDMRRTAPAIEMVPNPAFSFPMKPLTPSVSNEYSDAPRRPMSMFLQPALPVTTAASHTRTASALPSFSFNAGNTSGRGDGSTTPPQTPDENMMSADSLVRKGHRRGGSEYVGGDSRFGVTNAITSSPTKTELPTLPVSVPSPAGRRGAHAHRRSVAVSSHDLSQIMSGDKSPRLSSSLPSTPMVEFPRLEPAPVMLESETRNPERDVSPVRPPSRPRVEFVEQVEIIPRPLSTISSETDSSVSTIVGHSVSNSISSVLSHATPAAHTRTPSVGHASVGSIAEPRSKPHRSSLEVSKRVEKEGEWLKSRSVSQPQLSTSQLPVSEPMSLLDHTPAKRQKRASFGYSLGFDRRRSEPLMSTSSPELSRLSALSLEDTLLHDSLPQLAADSAADKRTSSQRLKQWALSKLQRRHKPQVKPSTTRPDSADSVDVPGKVSVARDDVVAETDLDAVFGNESGSSSPPRFGSSPSQISFENASPFLEGSSGCSSSSGSSRPGMIDLDDASPMVDLDAALGPLRTPPLGSSHRRHMHSDRPTKTSTGGGLLHRRAESEPVLMAFNRGNAAQKSMEDVFEEDEEDVLNRDEAGMDITMVDMDRSAFDPANPESQRLRRAARESDRPFTSYITPSTLHLAVPSLDRPASLVDDVIVEEASPVEASPVEVGDEVEIVQAHEEPRAASLEKSSDSSEASTLLGAPLSSLTDEHEEGVAPDEFPSSLYPSPDFSRRQGSFDATRLGTSASSITDTRTTSSCTTGEPGHEVRMSVDDVPSLTSSRSTMMSNIHVDNPRRDISDSRMYEAVPRPVDIEQVAARRKKRASMQSLSQLVGGTFGTKHKPHDESSRPQTATLLASAPTKPKKDNRLKKLMFWRSKQNLRQAALEDPATTV